jgi:DNA ligase 1
MEVTRNQLAGAFSEFARTADAIAATTKRNEKSALLGEYFSSLSDADLAVAARFLAGYIFPLWDQRTTNIGGSALLNAMSAMLEINRQDLVARTVALGDLGDVAFEAFNSRQVKGPDVKLQLADVAARFDLLAATAGSKAKTALLAGLLARCAPQEAKYVVKLLAGDLRIGLKEGSVEDAISKLTGWPAGDVQWANMLTGDIGETALLARRGALGEARMRLFHPIKFMLATPAPDLEDVARHMPTAFFVEDKFDGIRAQAHIAHVSSDEPGKHDKHGTVIGDVRVALFSRTLDEITESFPDLIKPLATIVAEFKRAEGSAIVLDGEIVPQKDGLVLPFLELQKRLGRKTLPKELLEKVPAGYRAFDILYGANRVLISEPLSVRRTVLEALQMSSDEVRRADSRLVEGTTELDDEFAAARARGNEGLMVKSPESIYKPGRRGREWLKIKRAVNSLDVVVTAVEVGNGRRSHLLSDYTFAVRASETDGTLLNVGKAYSGLTDAELEELSQWFRAHTVREFAHGKVRIVEPKIVIEVTFDLVQNSNRHKSGFALRFPRIVRLRPDKTPSEIDTLQTVQRLAGGGEPAGRE